jgi:hypothetical protein
MAIKMTLNRTDFIKEMQAIRPDNFSREGLGELFFYFDEMGEENEMEFDPIAICCDFSQCSLEEFEQAYPAIAGIQLDEGLTLEDSIKDYIENNGFWFAFVEDGKEIIYENF